MPEGQSGAASLAGKAVFRHVSIAVSDLERARDFYGRILGLAEIPRPDLGVPGIWYGLDGGLQLHILAKPDPAGPQPQGQTFSLTDPHFALACSDVAATAAALAAQGLKTFENRPPGGGFAQVFVKDADGNMVEFIGPA